MEKQLKEIIRSVIREEFISEMSKNDIHVKEIMKFYDKGSYSTKKAVSIFVCGKPNATRNQILDELGDLGYNEIWDVMDHFKLTLESTKLNEGFGDAINKIRNLAVRMASTKFDRAKSHLDINKIASSGEFDGKDAMNKATSALLQQSEINEDLKSAINKIAVKLGTGATMMSIITALVSMSGWIKYLDSSFTKWYYTEIQKLAEPEVMKVMQDLGRAGQEEGSIYGKLGMYAFFIFFTIAVISLVAARMTQTSKNEIAVQTDEIPGGLASGKTMKDFLKKYNSNEYYDNSQMAEKIKEKIQQGVKVEMEHTNDPKVAFEIAKDHVWEDLNYYDKLKKVEEYVDKKGVEHVAAALPQTEEEPVNEGSLYSSQQLIQKLTPKIQKDVELLKKEFPNYDIELVKNRYESDGSYTLSISGKNTSTTDNNKLQKVIKAKIKESVTEALVKGKTYGGSKCEGGCFVGKSGLMKIIKISKDSPKDVFMFRDDNYSGLQPHFIKNGVIAKATVINPAYDLEKHKVKNLKIGNDVILSVRLFVSTNESVNESNDCGCI